MAILAVGGIKGGTGKTTVATNFACIAAGHCQKILLVDADDQKTASDFTSARNQDHSEAPAYTCIRLTGKNVRSEVLKIAGDYKHIFIDTGGRDTTSLRAALTMADTLLIPFAPRSFDIWTLDQVTALVEEVSVVNTKLQSFTFINHADAAGQGSENSEAAAMLKENPTLRYLDAVLGRRKAFSHAATQGLSVTELRRPQRDQKAIDEIEVLYQRCLNVDAILSTVSSEV